MENKRIITISDWKKTNAGKISEEIVNTDAPVSDDEAKLQSEIDGIVDYAKELELPKVQTIDYVKSIFVDPIKAPEEISANFVKDNLDKIVSEIESIPDAEWPKQSDFLSVGEMFKKEEPKQWAIFKLDENKLDDFIKNNKANFIYNKLGYIYIPNVININESFIKNLDKNGAKIKYEKTKWIKNILK